MSAQFPSAICKDDLQKLSFKYCIDNSIVNYIVLNPPRRHIRGPSRYPSNAQLSPSFRQPVVGVVPYMGLHLPTAFGLCSFVDLRLV